jgi:peptidoglycan/LPS O-acetylase OafA/YrhL
VADGHAEHLYEIDVIRIITFGAVVAVHAIAFTELPSNRLAGGALMVLQFGRELFFALMGFVLVYSAQRRYSGSRAFWRRRFLFVGVPYLAWTALYSIEDRLTGLHHALLSDLLTGDAEYHLYFLLVTMQLYLAFPLILRFVRRTASRAWAVLAVMGALNVAWLAALHYTTPPTGWAAGLWGRAYELLPTYAVYVLAGCYGAMHVERLVAVVRRSSGLLVRVGVTAAVLALVAYAAQLPSRAPRDAADVLQPAMLLTCAAAVLLLSVCGVRWAYGARRGERLVRQGSDISFGVYLAHPLVLRLLLAAGLGNDGQRVAAPLATVVAFVGAAAGAAVLTVVARRTPLSLALTGRSRLPAPAPALIDLPADSAAPLRVLSGGEATIAS